MKGKPIKSIIAVGVGVGATSIGILSSKKARTKVANYTTFIRNKLLPIKYKKTSFPLKKAGNPHPEDIADNNMVSEGAMYSVKYYNKKMQ